MRLALEYELGVNINVDIDVIPRLIIQAGVLLNSFHDGPDNGTAHERLRVNTSRPELVDF